MVHMGWLRLDVFGAAGREVVTPRLPRAGDRRLAAVLIGTVMPLGNIVVPRFTGPHDWRLDAMLPGSIVTLRRARLAWASAVKYRVPMVVVVDVGGAGR